MISQFGNKINWHRFEALYSKSITNGLSTIKLQQSTTDVNGDDIIVNVTGTVSIDPQDQFSLLLDVDQDITIGSNLVHNAGSFIEIEAGKALSYTGQVLNIGNHTLKLSGGGTFDNTNNL